MLELVTNQMKDVHIMSYAISQTGIDQKSVTQTITHTQWNNIVKAMFEYKKAYESNTCFGQHLASFMLG
jgi:hypothetical protein